MPNTKIQSHSDRTAHPLQQFFVPSRAAWVLFFLLGTILIVAYNSSQIISWVGNNYLQSADNSSANLGVLNNGISSSFNTTLEGRLGQIVFWSLVGALVYIAVWFGRNLLNSFENDVIIERYRHPSGFTSTGYWSSAIAGKVFFAAALVLFVTYTYFIAKIVLPAAGVLTGNAVFHFRLAASLIYIFLSVLIAAVAVYIWFLLARILSHIWKLL